MGLFIAGAMLLVMATVPYTLWKLADRRVTRARARMAGLRSHRRRVDQEPDWPAADQIQCPRCGKWINPWGIWMGAGER